MFSLATGFLPLWLLPACITSWFRNSGGLGEMMLEGSSFQSSCLGDQCSLKEAAFTATVVPLQRNQRLSMCKNGSVEDWRKKQPFLHGICNLFFTRSGFRAHDLMGGWCHNSTLLLLSFFFFFFFIGVKLLYNVVLVSAVQWSESALCIPISPPSWTSLLPNSPPPPPHLGHHRAPSWAPCAIQQVPTS